MNNKNIFFALIFYFLIIALMTFPLLFLLTSHIPGFFSTDESFALLWDSWRIKHALETHQSFRQTDYIGYPLGVDLYASVYPVFGWLLWHYALSILTNPILTFNIQVLLNLLASCLAVYALVFYLTRNMNSALLSGIIFGLCPYQMTRTWQHLGLTYNQWIPLVIFAAILLKDRFSKKRIFFFSLILLLGLTFDFTIMYLFFVGLASLCLYLLFFNWKKKVSENMGLIAADFVYFRRLFLIGLIVTIILLPQFLPVIKNRFIKSTSTFASAHNPYHRPFEDLFEQSARPLSYFLPSHAHPLFGSITEQFVGTPLYGISFTEHTLYLGWVSLLLSFVAFKRWRKRKEGEYFYIGFFIFLAVTSWFFSQPPQWQIFNLKVPMPSFYMYKVLPMFRAYCRFGILLMFAISVLAGYGAMFFLQRFKAKKTNFAISFLLFALVLFEFWSYPPYKVIDVSSVPDVYTWLKAQPADTVIAKYPLDFNSPNEKYKLYQTMHEKKMINAALPGTKPFRIVNTITELSDIKTVGTLKWLGVKYVIVNKDDYLKTELVEDIGEFAKISDNPGLKFVRSFPAQACGRNEVICLKDTGRVDVYEVVTAPIQPEIK